MDPTAHLHLAPPFAVIADIHGNSAALAAVLADIDAQGIADIVNLGDHFSGPLDAAGTWDLLRDRPMLSILGNHDRYLLDQTVEEMGPSDRVAREELPDEAMDWLAALPVESHLGHYYMCHGTPMDDNKYWMEVVAGEGVMLAPRVKIEKIAEGIEAPLILCAHSHVPRVLELSSGRILANPGSVGCPAYSDVAPSPHRVEIGSPHARYAVVNRVPGGWDVVHRAVVYDVAPMVAKAQAHGRDDWARAVGTGWL